MVRSRDRFYHSFLWGISCKSLFFCNNGLLCVGGRGPGMQLMKSTQLRIKTMKQSCAVNYSQRDRFGHQGCLSSPVLVWTRGYMAYWKWCRERTQGSCSILSWGGLKMTTTQIYSMMQAAAWRSLVWTENQRDSRIYSLQLILSTVSTIQRKSANKSQEQKI